MSRTSTPGWMTAFSVARQIRSLIVGDGQQDEISGATEKCGSTKPVTIGEVLGITKVYKSASWIKCYGLMKTLTSG